MKKVRDGREDESNDDREEEKKMSMKHKNKTMTILEYLYLIAYLKYLDHHLLKNSFKTEVNP